ncbi:MAG: hypothetical protein Q4G49_00340 [Paracoccus sp. (in: a-proteobacteria)]|nr:hypothetical protein [Paracoccus sp. (in: a-proteobacteria)]
MARIVAFVVMLMLPGLALAGAWPRDEAGVFLSFSAEKDGAGNRYTGLYGEYGLTARRTLGFELGHTKGEHSLLIWVQRAIGDDAAHNRWAVSAGGGAIHRDGRWLPVGQAGASWGRGFQGIMQGGWLAGDSRIRVTGRVREVWEIAADGGAYLTPESEAKLDLTLGLRVMAGLMVINQLRFEYRDDTGSASKLATSVVRDIYGPAKIEFGAIVPVAGRGERAVKIGTWFEF